MQASLFVMSHNSLSVARVVPGCKSVAVTTRGCGDEIFIAGHTLADDTLVSVLAGRLGRTPGSSSWQCRRRDQALLSTANKAGHQEQAGEGDCSPHVIQGGVVSLVDCTLVTTPDLCSPFRDPNEHCSLSVKGWTKL